MPDGSSSVIDVVKTGAGALGGLGAAASGISGVASLFQKKPQAPDTSALMGEINAEREREKQERTLAEEEAAKKRRLISSGAIGQRSLFSNGETGFMQTLGGG